MSKRETREYLPHINGMRALAIALVVLYHLEAELCPCGYFGVDVFLVISGYFIFSRELRAERVEGMHYGGYLLRKMWRIGPPTLLVGCLVAVLGAFILQQDLYWKALQTLTYCCIGGSNEYVARSGNYFSPNTQSNPLMHLWYIGVIMQTYILLPLLAKGMRRWGAAQRGCVWWALGLSSLGLYLFLQYGEQWGANVVQVRKLREWFSPYYSIATRLWEPLAALLILQLPRIPDSRPLLQAAVAPAAVAAVVWSCYYFETGSASVFTAVAGAILLVRYGAAGVVGRVLGWRPVQWLGSISFSLYLVHLPIFAVWRYVKFDTVSAAELCAATLLSLLLAWVLYRRVETRCGARQKQLSRRALAWYSSCVPLCIILVTSVLTWCPPVARLLPNGSGEVQKSLELPILTGYATPEQLLGFPHDTFSHTPTLLGNDTAAPVSFLLLGDSHSWHLHYGLDKLLRERGGLRGLYLNNSCIPAWDTFILLSAGDSKWDRARGEKLLAWLCSRKDIDCVILSAYWHLRFSAKSLRNWDLQPIPPELARAHQEEGLRETCRQLKQAGKRVIVLKGTPTFPYSQNHVEKFLRLRLLGIEHPLPVRSPQQVAARLLPEEPFMRSLQEQNLAEVIDVCPALQEDGMYPIRLKDGRFLYRDSNHLAAPGSELVAAHVLRYLLQRQ